MSSLLTAVVLHGQPLLVLLQAPISSPGRNQSNTSSQGAGLSVTVFVGHLRSYVGMGTAAMACGGGCNCTTLEVNANHVHRTSQSFLTSLLVR